MFIDYEKAFDNKQRQILFNILKSRHIPDTLLKPIVDIYTQNKILIKFNNKLSKLVEINNLFISTSFDTPRLPSFTYTV